MKNKEDVIIHLENVSKYYHMGETVVKAVDGITLSVKKGEFVAVMGPSGSGKSTSMHLIGSLDVGFIFQQFNLIPTLTVRENIMLPLSLQGIPEEERWEKVDKLIKKMELTERANHFPNQISGGQQQRVAIARALANDPEVILADEPTGNLDTKTGERVMDFLQQLNKEGRTIVMVTHSPELAKEYADIVYWLKDGKIQKTTTKKSKSMKKVGKWEGE